MAAEKAAKPAAPNPAALIPALQNIMHLEIVIPYSSKHISRFL